MIVKVVNEPPEAIDQANPNTPAVLSSLTMQCLAKDPQNRPANTDTIATTLARWLRPETLKLARPNTAKTASTIARITGLFKRKS